MDKRNTVFSMASFDTDFKRCAMPIVASGHCPMNKANTEFKPEESWPTSQSLNAYKYYENETYVRECYFVTGTHSTSGYTTFDLNAPMCSEAPKPIAPTSKTLRCES
jgi:hypothetical protein